MATIIGAVVACSPDALTESSAVPIGSKSVSPTKEEVALNQYLFEVWRLSDSAYRADSLTYMKCCEDEILNDYFNMINVPKNVLTIIDSLANIIPHNVVYDPGNPFFDTTGCFACSYGKLSAYGTNVEKLRKAFNILAGAGSSDTIPIFMPYIDSCYAKCYKQSFDINQISPEICYMNCVLKRSLRDAEHYMSQLNL